MTVQLLHFIDKRVWGKVTWLESYSDLVNTRAQLGIQPSWLLTQCSFLPHQTASQVGESSGRGVVAGLGADFYPHLWLFRSAWWTAPCSLWQPGSVITAERRWSLRSVQGTTSSDLACASKQEVPLRKDLTPCCNYIKPFTKSHFEVTGFFFFFGPVFQYIKCNYFIVDLLVITGMCLNMIYWVSFVPVDLQ